MKILILRLSSMGDVLLATPVLDVLKSEFPRSEIDWVINKKFEETLSTNPVIRRLLVFKDKKGLKNIRREIKRTNYDMIFDLHKNSSTRYLSHGLKNVFTYKKRVFDRFMLVHFKKAYKEIMPVTQMYFKALERAGIPTPGNYRPRFGLDKDIEVKTVENYGLHNKNYIVMIPGASYSTKMWPEDYFRQLAERIIGEKSKNRNVIIIGKGAAESKISKYIAAGSEGKITDLTDRLTLQETASVIKFADAVVTNDNGPMHMAECFGKKIVAIFGSTTEEFGFFPYSTNYRVVENRALKCRPCTHFGRKKCPKKHFGCMNGISVNDVHEALEDILES